jgi:DNA-binding MarR family transcriptional regulator
MPAPIQSAFCACFGVRRADRAVLHLYDQVLGPTGLKATQFMMLRAISEHVKIAHCDLAAELAASVETLSRRLASARKAGFVQVHSGEHNRRLYRLTLKGKRALEEALPHWRKAEDRLQRALGEADWQLLLSFSQRLAAAARTAEVLPLTNGNSQPLPRAKTPGPASCYSNTTPSLAKTSTF